MALLFMDSFDHYAIADITEKYTSQFVTGSSTMTIDAVQGRHASSGLKITHANIGAGSTYTNVTKTLAPTSPTFVYGFGFKASQVGNSGTAGNTIIGVMDTGTMQVCITLHSDMTLKVKRGDLNGTLLGSVSIPLSVSAFYWIEFMGTIHPTTGSVEVRVNGLTGLLLTNQNTRNTANSSWNGLYLGCQGGVGSASTSDYFAYDDLYVLDGAGSAPFNTFLGEIRVDARFPMTPAGANSGWTPSAGSNFQNVDEAAPNDDTDYNQTSTVGVLDTFTVQDAPVTGVTLYGVQHCVSMKKLDVGVCSVAPVIRHSGADTPGANLSPNLIYGYGLQVAVEVAPGVPFTEANFNAAEFGYKRTA